MKKITLLSVLLFLNISFAAPHLEVVKKHVADFVNMALVTQMFPLSDGGFIVQRYGHLISRYDANSQLIKEIDVGTDDFLYQKGTQLKDGRIVFINADSYISFYDMDLNKLAEYYVPLDYIWAPCELSNGKLVYGTYNDEAIVIMNKDGKFSEFGNLGTHLRKTYCLENDRAMVLSDEGMLSVVDLSTNEAKLVHQKTFNSLPGSLKLLDTKAHFLTSEGMTVLDTNTYVDTLYPNSEIKKFSGVDYFTDGRYVLINTERNTEGNYDSILKVYSKEGKELGSNVQYKTGGTTSSQALIIDDRYILTNHCSRSIVLFEMGQELVELDRIKSTEWFCSNGIAIDSNNFVFEGRQSYEYVIYHLRMIQ